MKRPTVFIVVTVLASQLLGVCAQAQISIAIPEIKSLNRYRIEPSGEFTITGTGFENVISVEINGVHISKYEINKNDHAITAMLPASATSGYVTVSDGTYSSQSPKVMIVGPTIVGFSPQAVTPGLTVTVSGLNFSDVTEVNLGSEQINDFTVSSPTTLTFAVPEKAATSLIGVHANGMSATSTDYLQLPMPVQLEYKLLKRAIAYLDLAVKAVRGKSSISNDNFNTAIGLLNRTLIPLARYLSAESTWVNDALTAINGAIQILNSPTLTATDKSSQALELLAAALTDVTNEYQSFGYKEYTDPGTYLFIVRDGTTSVYIQARGGDGGDGYDSDNNTADFQGDGGESKSGTYTVTPGEILTVTVSAGAAGNCDDGDGGHGGGVSVISSIGGIDIQAHGGGGAGGDGGGCGSKGGNGKLNIYW
jgi:hypothetical protein